MLKYHVNPATGDANKCLASIQDCKFAESGVMPPHFDNIHDAQSYFEAIQSQGGDFMASESKHDNLDEAHKQGLTQAYKNLQKSQAKLMYSRVDGAEREILENNVAIDSSRIAILESKETISRMAEEITINDSLLVRYNDQHVGEIKAQYGGFIAIVNHDVDGKLLNLGVFATKEECKYMIAGWLRSRGYSF